MANARTYSVLQLINQPQFCSISFHRGRSLIKAKIFLFSIAAVMELPLKAAYLGVHLQTAQMSLL